MRTWCSRCVLMARASSATAASSHSPRQLSCLWRWRLAFGRAISEFGAEPCSATFEATPSATPGVAQRRLRQVDRRASLQRVCRGACGAPVPPPTCSNRRDLATGAQGSTERLRGGIDRGLLGRTQRRTLFRPAGPLVAALGAALFSASLVFASSLIAATGPDTDPFAGCTVGNGSGLNYIHSEVEPYGAINPTNSPNIITVQQQDRWDNGGARGLSASVSRNGGASWEVVALPFSACAANAPADLQYERASDPWVSFGPGTSANPSAGATAYAVSISFNQSPGRNGNTVGAAVPSDGGTTWQRAQTLAVTPTLACPCPCRTATSSTSTTRSP